MIRVVREGDYFMTSIPFIKASSLSNLVGLEHGFFTREGGVSSGIYASLNCSHGSRDSSDNVTENRNGAMQALGLARTTLYGVYQIHSSTVHHIRPGMSTEYRRGDALVANEPGVALSVLGADCAPILFADSKNRVIAAAHSGWKGALSGIVQSTLNAMLNLGAEKQCITAVIGPAIAQGSYEVKQDFIDQFSARYTGSMDTFIDISGSRYYFDLTRFIQDQFKQAGIDAVERLDNDTFADKRFFSYRRTTQAGESDYGRQISIISLT